MDHSSLTTEQYEQAIAVLEKEQSANIPTLKEIRWFNYFAVSVYFFTAAYLIDLVVHLNSVESFLRDTGHLEWISNTTFFALYALEVITVILLIFNFPLIRKLITQAIFRRKQHISLEDSIEYQAHRPKYYQLIYLEKLLAILGLGIMLFEIYNFITFFSAYGKEVDAPLSEQGQFPLNYILARILGPLTLGPSMVIRYLIRRGKDRILAVSQLQHSLSQNHRNKKGNITDGINISDQEYDQLARLERSRLVHELRVSLNSDEEVSEDFQYVIKKSKRFREKIAKLETDAQIEIDNEVLKLVEDPDDLFSQSSFNGEYLVLNIPDSDYEIYYQIDAEKKCIRVYDLGTP